MKPLRLEELPSPAAFEAMRPVLREAILEHKNGRRIALGDRVTLLFEDRETVRWQVLEMSRVEGLTEPEAIQHELDVYNELVPGEGELSATLFIEITDLAEVRPELDRLIGMDEHLNLRAGGERIAARFDEAQMEEDRISAVHYVRFALTPAARAALDDPSQRVELEIDHPAYRVNVELPDALRTSLRRDLEGGAPELVPVGDRPRADHGDVDRVLERRGRIQIVRPARPRVPGHLFVEPSPEAPAFHDASDELWIELLAVAREVARNMEEQLGGCRLLVDSAAPLRLELYAPARR